MPRRSTKPITSAHLAHQFLRLAEERSRTHAGVSTIDAEVGTRRERTRVGSEVDDGALEVLGLSDTAHGSEVDPGFPARERRLVEGCEGRRGGCVLEGGLAVEDNAGEGGL